VSGSERGGKVWELGRMLWRKEGSTKIWRNVERKRKAAHIKKCMRVSGLVLVGDVYGGRDQQDKHSGRWNQKFKAHLSYWFRLILWQRCRQEEKSTRKQRWKKHTLRIQILAPGTADCVYGLTSQVAGSLLYSTGCNGGG